MRTGTVAALVAVLVVAAAIVQWLRPLPPVSARLTRHTAVVAGPAPAIAWPGGGVQAALDVPAIGWLGRHGPTAPLSIGSVAKVMTAYLLLKRHPLGPYANGPAVAVTPGDVAAYQADVATQQSAMPVVQGTRLSERTLLEGLLVASANNIADLVARWLDGSTAQFVAAMNAQARALGLGHTHYVDPSGLDPATTSTAADQVRLAEAAMRLPSFAQTVAMPAMSVPPSGAVAYNYNGLVGHDGIVGVKTGSTVAGKASFVWAAERQAGGTDLWFYGAVLGQGPTATTNQLALALDDGRTLLDASVRAVGRHTLVAAGESVGNLTAPWAAPVPVAPARTLRVLGWGGLAVPLRVRFRLPHGAAAGVPAGTRVGTLSVDNAGGVESVALVTTTALPPPTPLWRLLRL